MPNLLSIEEFLREREQDLRPLLDVRSPGEYDKGHIPGALSFPLFDNQERSVVGTLYKKQGKGIALRKGLEFVGPKLGAFLDQAEALSPERKLFVHCWRGGKRSESMAMLFRAADFEVGVLKGGYKAFRNHIHRVFEQPFKLWVLGGETGSGKTYVLKALADRGQQVLDLEGLANHRGSAFGSLMLPEQPSTEQFENLMFEQLHQFDPSRPIWVEDESMRIGKVFIPEGFWRQMEKASLIRLKVPMALRVENLVKEYALAQDEDLRESLGRIEKRLGGQHVKAALKAMEAKDYGRAAEIALRYYDKAYRYGLEKKAQPPWFRLEVDHFDAGQIAEQLIEETKVRR
jgi:tRNA 2-selenouridine synthase